MNFMNSMSFVYFSCFINLLVFHELHSMKCMFKWMPIVLSPLYFKICISWLLWISCFIEFHTDFMNTNNFLNLWIHLFYRKFMIIQDLFSEYKGISSLLKTFTHFIIIMNFIFMNDYFIILNIKHLGIQLERQCRIMFFNQF